MKKTCYLNVPFMEREDFSFSTSLTFVSYSLLFTSSLFALPCSEMLEAGPTGQWDGGSIPWSCFGVQTILRAAGAEVQEHGGSGLGT